MRKYCKAPAVLFPLPGLYPPVCRAFLWLKVYQKNRFRTFFPSPASLCHVLFSALIFLPGSPEFFQCRMQFRVFWGPELCQDPSLHFSNLRCCCRALRSASCHSQSGCPKAVCSSLHLLPRYFRWRTSLRLYCHQNPESRRCCRQKWNSQSNLRHQSLCCVHHVCAAVLLVLL